jgi:tRNA nucleotidyltransferase (CCA-adding enzyme)
MTRPLPRPVRVYRVGGSVRDELLNRPPGDRDYVVVGATPEIMLASGYRPVGRDFPVFLHPETQEEYALARTERKHGRGYRGFEFFATPDVTLEEDLRRRDLTINAMARTPDGTLIDPYGGKADLEAGILRHVSSAFAEDPLRVLRVARFAARFGFRIADSTLALMREISASGELATLAPERVWQELARGLGEAHPSLLLRALRACGALGALLPEIDTLYAVRIDGDDAGSFTERALDWSAGAGHALPARYAVLTQELDHLPPLRASAPVRISTRTGVLRAEAMSARLKAPADCRDAARLAARWHRFAARAHTLPAARLLDIVMAADALRRPERLETLIDAAAAHLAAGGVSDEAAAAAAAALREALAAAKSVDAASIARDTLLRTVSRKRGKAIPAGDRIAKALRSARLAAIRERRKTVAG